MSIPVAVSASTTAPRPTKRRCNATEPPTTEVDSDLEEQQDLEVARIQFPSMLDPKRTDDEAHDVYENITFCPGYRKMERLKRKWMQEHPAVRSSGEESGAE